MSVHNKRTTQPYPNTLAKTTFLLIMLVMIWSFSACSNKFDPPSDESLFQDPDQGVSVMADTGSADTDASSDDPPLGSYTTQYPGTPSPNGKWQANIIGNESSYYSHLLFDGPDNSQLFIKLDEQSMTSINSADWIDNDHYAITGHVNPSTSIYMLASISERKFTAKYYGLGFTWNKSKDKLYYVQTSPHFAEHQGDRIIDSNQHVYYESGDGEFIIDHLVISDNEQVFAFYVDTEENRTLLIGKKDAQGKLIIQSSREVPLGELEIMNNRTVKLTLADGNVFHYSI